MLIVLMCQISVAQDVEYTLNPRTGKFDMVRSADWAAQFAGGAMPDGPEGSIQTRSGDKFKGASVGVDGGLIYSLNDTLKTGLYASYPSSSWDGNRYGTSVEANANTLWLRNFSYKEDATTHIHNWNGQASQYWENSLLLEDGRFWHGVTEYTQQPANENPVLALLKAPAAGFADYYPEYRSFTIFESSIKDSSVIVGHQLKFGSWGDNQNYLRLKDGGLAFKSQTGWLSEIPFSDLMIDPGGDAIGGTVFREDGILGYDGSPRPFVSDIGLGADDMRHQDDFIDFDGPYNGGDNNGITLGSKNPRAKKIAPGFADDLTDHTTHRFDKNGAHFYFNNLTEKNGMVSTFSWGERFRVTFEDEQGVIHTQLLMDGHRAGLTSDEEVKISAVKTVVSGNEVSISGEKITFDSGENTPVTLTEIIQKGQIIPLDTEPDIPTDSFAFWVNGTDFWLILDSGGVQKKIQMF